MRFQFIWEFQLFRLSLPFISVDMWRDVLMTKALNDTCGGNIRIVMQTRYRWRAHMLVSTCMPEQVSQSCMECHTKDPLNALTEQFHCTPFSPFRMFQVPFPLWNAWKQLLSTGTNNVLSLLSPKRAPNWFQGEWFPQTWMPAVIGLYVTHPFAHAR